MIANQRLGQFAVLVGICLQMIVLNVDMTIVNVAIPSISKSLHLSLAVSSGLINTYIALTGALLILGAKLANRFGSKRIFIIATLLFVLGSILCGVATNSAMIILGRNIQSLGAGMSLTIMAPMLFNVFSKKTHGFVMGILSLCIGIAQAIGPTLGGFLLTVSTWRSIFFINVPLGLLAFILVALFYQKNDQQESKLHDLKSMLVIFLAIFIFIVGMNNIPLFGIVAWQSLLPMLIGIILAVVFFQLQKSAAVPSINLALFSIERFKIMGYSRALFQYGFYTTIFIQVLYMHFVMQLDAMTIGLVLAIKTAAFGFLSPVFGSLRQKISDSLLQSTGIAITALVAFCFALLAHDMSLLKLCLLLLLSGIGTAMVMPTTVPSVLGVLDAQDMQMGSAVLYLLMLFGGALGVGVSTAILHASLSDSSVYSILTSGHIWQAHLSHKDLCVFSSGVVWIYGVSGLLQLMAFAYMLCKTKKWT